MLLTGENESTLVEQSSGIHLLEINGSGLGSNDGNGWSWMEILCVVLCFIFVFSSRHICHYCLFTKKVVKSRIRETPTLSTDADSKTDTILERLRDLPIRTKKRT